ncbi:mitochondrial carrier [Gonapodya prolifera JEL478]|uniref:Mitochondrial carrier n=1 Tax=Gonapodya prolifera (strain JEL478) TaxID=1344416 RepID=A0A139AWL6_GONPJ|nr:mitochondrial carrier [Gonapodya prolifera JEL478]|eukprot:KXS20865.1 mitochondrial carrier [Gonapodya prolifera JEL478]
MSSEGAPKQPVRPLPFQYALLAGAIAGCTEICVMYPLDVVKTRLQLEVGRGQYSSMYDCMRQIVVHEGPLKLYRGMIPPILAEAPKRAVKFGANDTYTGIARKWGFGASQATSTVVGLFAGMSEGIVICPSDLVKIRLQDKANAGKYKNTIDCMVKVTRSEGILAFYNGLGATLWRNGSWNAGYFGVIHFARGLMPVQKDDSKAVAMFKNFLSGALGGTVGTMINTPFDMLKSRIQNSPMTDRTYKPTLRGYALVYRTEGFQALYKGFVPKVWRLGPGGGILLVVYDASATWIRRTFQV